MAKKKQKSAKSEDEAKLPAFGGFKPLAGLEAFKKKIADDQKADDEARAKAKLPPKPPPRPQVSSPKPTATSGADEEHSFHRMMAGVVPLDAKAGRVAKTEGASAGAARIKPAEMRERAKVEAEQALDHLHSLVDETAFEVSDDGTHVEGRRADTPPNLVRSLRRGLLPIDARLDLHGLTAAEAQAKLASFLRETRTRGERCVLVIHGKGEHSTAPGGVLRGEIAAWLSQGRAREHVAAFASAQREDGGEGAVYIALRR